MVLPTQFMPDSNNDFAQVRVETVPGTTLAQTEAITAEVTRVLRARPETAMVQERIQEGSARVFVVLKKQRKLSTVAFTRELTPVLQAIPDARVTFQANGPSAGGSGRPISIMLAGSDPVLLERTAATLVEQMKGLKELVAPGSAPTCAGPRSRFVRASISPPASG